jgi:hypothetical protein
MIDWMAFVTVFVASLVSACAAMTLFSLALRLGDGEATWRRPVSVALYVLCALVVIFGIYIIIGDHVFTLFSR